MGIITDIVLPVALAFIMFALGLGLTFADFARVARQPRDFLIGVASQLILLPAVAWLLVSVWSLPPELALGVMIIAAAPGGVTSNILTALARGDVALSISLTAVISLVCVVTIPLIVVFAHDRLMDGSATGDVSVAKTAISVFVIVTVPVTIGLLVRHFAAGFSRRVEPAVRHISTVLFIIVLAGAIYQERANIVTYFAQAGLITLTLNVVMMVLAYCIARLFASGPRQRITISMECGLQNGTLAIAVAAILFGGGLVAVPAATYSLIMFATALIYVAIARRSVKQA
ncbi:MAG: bile acid:sodium symporter family protein [Alphaproteobacteria bacterium]|jgi:BASS family bile acid:Na+ symporter|nr:bile acid:sodium symporter family protein [Alphaproteobacteria bacterium]